MRRHRATKRSQRPGDRTADQTRDTKKSKVDDVQHGFVQESVQDDTHPLTPKAVKVLVEHERTQVSKEVVVQVVEILRFCPSRNINTITGLFDLDPRSAYDVVITDGKLKMKCLMSPRLNSLVEKGRLTVHSVLKLTDYSKRYDDADPENGWVLVLNEVHLIGVGPPRGNPSYPRRLAHRFSVPHQPSIGPRISYVSLYNNDYLQVQTLKSNHLNLEADEIKAVISDRNEQQLVSIAQLAQTMNVGRVRPGDKSTSGHLLARIVGKSKVIHYSKPSSTAKYPVFFELFLDDMTGTCKAVLWTSLLVYYDSIRVGDIIFLRKFRVRVLPEGEFELVVNPASTGPESIAVIPSVGSIARLPRLECALVPLTHILQMPDNQKFDFCGVVLYKSIRQREYNARRECYFEYRWFLLTDFSCRRALPLKAYTNSQDPVLNDLKPGDHMLATNLNCFSIGDVDASSSPRSLCVSSSQLTTYIHDERAATIMGEAAMEALTQGLEKSTFDELQKVHRSTYLWIKDQVSFKAVFNLETTPLREVASIVSELSLYEVKTLTVQGYLNWLVVHEEGVEDVIGTMSIQDVNKDMSLAAEVSANPCPHAHMAVPVVNRFDLADVCHDQLLGLLRLLPATPRVGAAASALVEQLTLSTDDYPLLAEFFQRAVGPRRQLFNLRLQRLPDRVAVTPVGVLPV